MLSFSKNFFTDLIAILQALSFGNLNTPVDIQGNAIVFIPCKL